MRDLVLTVLLFGSLPFIVKRPVYGAFLWVWVSVMNPHRQTWGFAYDMPFAQLIALATLLGIFFHKGVGRMPKSPVVFTLFLFAFWMNVTTVFALEMAGSYFMWDRVMKIMFMTFIVLYLVRTKQHVQVLIWVATLSVAFYGVKGGLFTVRGGGVERVYGPAGSFISDNNALALAVIMTIPLLRFLHLQATNRWVRYGLLASMVLCGFAALGSQSRGGLLGIGAMLSFLWLKGKSKIITGFALLMLVPIAIGFMPQKWIDRMQSIENYAEDGSAQGRINAWRMAINLAAERPLTGGGFNIYHKTIFARYAPNPEDVHSAHSIYFQILGEHGYVGLCFFLLLWLLVWRDASWLVRHSRGREGWQWAGDLGRMVQVALVGNATGGAFLNLAYYDVPYYLLVAIVVTRELLEKEGKSSEQKGWYAANQHMRGAAGASQAEPQAGAPTTQSRLNVRP